MKPFQAIEDATLAAIDGIFSDIDDTLTTDRRMTAEVYAALWKLRGAGVHVVLVTGRPAGWCDLIARWWPIDAVVGENGALCFYMEGEHMKRLYHPEATADARARLAEVQRAILERVPLARVAQDQAFRLFDLAIDFCEEPPDLGLDTARAIRDVFLAHGAQAKLSSIHVNGWFGSYTKRDMCRQYLAEVRGVELAAVRGLYLYLGDSPNDEPMFELFPMSCAMANIAPFLDELVHQPAYVTEAEEGKGFLEVAGRVLKAHVRR